MGVGSGHTHPHGFHDHHLHGAVAGWRYGLAIILNIAIVAVQFGIGLAIGSSALMADAGHNLSDVAGLLLAGGAAFLMTRTGPARRTYGYGKAGVLAALANSLLLVFACGLLVFNAVGRLLAPPDAAPPGAVVMVVAGIAVGINIVSGWLLMAGHPDDVNRRAAVIHLFGDAAVSAGVVVAGGAMLLTGARWIDPVASLFIVGFILLSTWRVLVQAFDMAMDAAPRSIDVEAVRHWLATVPGVQGVHDLHIWPISATQTALTVHLVVPANSGDSMLAVVIEGLKDRFGIAHPTIQVERSDIDQCDGLHG